MTIARHFCYLGSSSFPLCYSFLRPRSQVKSLFVVAAVLDLIELKDEVDDEVTVEYEDPSDNEDYYYYYGRVTTKQGAFLAKMCSRLPKGVAFFIVPSVFLTF